MAFLKNGKPNSKGHSGFFSFRRKSSEENNQRSDNQNTKQNEEWVDPARKTFDVAHPTADNLKVGETDLDIVYQNDINNINKLKKKEGKKKTA